MKITKWFWGAAVIVLLVASQQEVRITGEPLPSQQPLLVAALVLFLIPIGIGMILALFRRH